MGIKDAIKSCLLTNYTNFSGRAKRSEFWYFQLFTIFVMFLDSLLANIAVELANTRGGSLSFSSAILCFGILLWIACPYFAVATRRLRDAGFEWVHIFWLFVPCIGWIVYVTLMCASSEEKRETKLVAEEAKIDYNTSFVDAVSLCLFKKYKDFKGRAGKREFWFFFFFFHFLLCCGTFMTYIIALSNQSGIGLIFPIFVLSISIYSICPFLAVSVRRLRDAGFSWYYIFFSIIPFPFGFVIMLIFMIQKSKDMNVSMR